MNIPQEATKDNLPQVVGEVDVLDLPGRPVHTPMRTGQQGPGRLYLHGGTHSQHAREVIGALVPGRARVLEFDSYDDLYNWRLLLLNVDRKKSGNRVRTKVRGNRLFVYLRESDGRQLRLLEA